MEFCPQTSNPNSSLYLFEKNQKVTTLISNIKSAVGFAFNKKERLFYFLDYCDNFISEFDWDPHSGAIGNYGRIYRIL